MRVVVYSAWFRNELGRAVIIIVYCRHYGLVDAHNVVCADGEIAWCAQRTPRPDHGQYMPQCPSRACHWKPAKYAPLSVSTMWEPYSKVNECSIQILQYSTTFKALRYKTTLNICRMLFATILLMDILDMYVLLILYG